MPSMTLTCFICKEPMHRGRTSKPQGEAAHNRCRTSGSRAHGTSSAYKRGCRCEECKRGQNERLRSFHEKKRAESGQVAQACTLCREPLVRYTSSTVPFHKACKDKAPQWMKDGLAEAPVKPVKVPKVKAAPRDLRSDIRAGYEDGDYDKFLRGLKGRVTVAESGCWEWQGRTDRGYAVINFSRRTVPVHRMVIEAREGKPLGVLAAHHMCGNSVCVNPEHLQPVTQRENMAEMLARNSLEARIEELEAALAALAPNHPVLDRVSHKQAALEVAA